MGMLIFSPTLKNLNSVIIPQRLDKNSGFVQEDNSGRSNIFSTGEKALYSFSPAAENAAKKGLGGIQGLSIAAGIIILVGLTTIGVSNNKSSSNISEIYITELNSLTEIASELRGPSTP